MVTVGRGRRGMLMAIKFRCARGASVGIDICGMVNAVASEVPLRPVFKGFSNCGPEFTSATRGRSTYLTVVNNNRPARRSIGGKFGVAGTVNWLRPQSLDVLGPRRSRPGSVPAFDSDGHSPARCGWAKSVTLAPVSRCAMPRHLLPRPGHEPGVRSSGA